MIELNKRKLFTCKRADDVTAEMVKKAIDLHGTRLLKDYLDNEKLYLSDHGILHLPKKESYKPDNRLVLNYAKYVVDTFTGYHLGLPCKVFHPENDRVTDFVTDFRQLNDMDDSEFEVAKLSSLFGHAFIYLYQDELGQTRMTYESPVNMILVYDDTVQELPYFAVRYALKENGAGGFGELITEYYQQSFTFEGNGDVVLGEQVPHIFSGLPVVELIENNERQGVFDSIKTLINALNKAVSEKANDVDYFADAYLKIIGMELGDEVAKAIRDSRVINLYATGGADKQVLDAAFLEKPNADKTQENLIRLLIDNIFTISMVSNISDENFGTSSGIALAYKLQPMDNLARTKDRKMKSALSQMYQLVFGVPKASVDQSAYLDLSYQFTRNLPKNIAEEAAIAKTLEGQVSKTTQLSVLSIVDDPISELERLKEEDSEPTRLSNRLRLQNGQEDE